MTEYPQTEATTLRRNASAARYDQQTIWDLIDAAPFCHLSAHIQGRPYIQATVHWRDGDKVYAHGAVKNKMIHAIAKGVEAALAFTHFDGYILARSAINHSVSYRSVTLFSRSRTIDDLEERKRLLALFVDRIIPGRSATIRQPTIEELKMTSVLEFEIKEASARVLMQGPQILEAMPGGRYEIADDAAFSPWTGIVPYAMVRRDGISAVDLRRQFTQINKSESTGSQ